MTDAAQDRTHEQGFEQSTADFYYRTWMRQTGGKVSFDEWKRDYDSEGRPGRRGTSIHLDTSDHIQTGNPPTEVNGRGKS